MHLLTVCLLVWAWATASTSVALLVVIGVQRIARVLGGPRSVRPLGVPYPEPVAGRVGEAAAQQDGDLLAAQTRQDAVGA